MKKTAILILSLLATTAPAAASEKILWQAGAFDGTSDEFAQGNPPRGREVVFHAGKSDPAREWFSFHPVASGAVAKRIQSVMRDAGAGRPDGHWEEIATARAIAFDLEGAPASGGFRLELSLLVERACVPALLVEVNGRRGLFYLHPKLDNRMGDSPGGNRTVYSHAGLAVGIPAAWLARGANRISLQPVATTAEFVADAGLNYDGARLVQTENAAAAVSASAEATVFYKKNTAGAGVAQVSKPASQNTAAAGAPTNAGADASAGAGLLELVRVDVRRTAGNAGGGVGVVELKLNGKTYTAPLRGAFDFGEERAEFWVPEFSGETEAEIKVAAADAAATFKTTLAAAKKWTVFLVPNVHFDNGYTDFHPKVAVLQSRLLEQALDVCEANPDFRFSVDASWTIRQFLRTHSDAEARRLVQAMRGRRVFSPAQSSSLLTGFPTAESLLRSFYDAANFSRENGVELNYTSNSDVPSPVWSYASVIAAAGLKYYLSGSNSDRGPAVLVGRYNEKSPMWWEGPDGGRVLFWYSRVYRQAQMVFGLPPIVDAGRDMLPVFLQAWSRPEYTSDATILWGTQGENRELFPQQGTLAERWAEEFAFPKIAYSGVAGAIDSIAKQLGDRVPVVRGCFGGYWEDGLAANPLRAGIGRGTERRALSAEKLATLAALVNPRLRVDKARLDAMWTDMLLYDEHTQVVSNSMPAHDTLKTDSQLKYKNSYADNAAFLANHLASEGSAQLVDSMNVGRDHVVVFNTLNWARDGLVTFDLGNGSELVDVETGGRAPFDIISKGGNFRRVHFLAKNVPAMGYRVYKTRAAARDKVGAADEVTMNIEDYQALERGIDVRPQPEQRQKNPEAVMENKFYRVELDAESGAVKSIFDKGLGRELVDRTSRYKFGQYVYMTGGDAKPNGILQYRKKAPQLTANLSGKGQIIFTRKIPFGRKARLESSAVFTPKITTEVRLWDDAKKIEFICEVRKEQVYRREGVYFAFPFAMKSPRFLYEIQNGVVDPARDILPGGCQEWFMVQNWAGVQQDGWAGAVVPVDAPLMTFGDVIRGAWPMEFGGRPGVIFSHVVNNYHQPRSIIDFKPEVKEDRLTFRYVVTSAEKLEPAKLSRLGWGEMTPLEWSHVQPQDKSWIRPQPLDGQKGAFINVPDDNLVLTALKQAEDGNGIIIRFLDLGGPERNVTVASPLVKIEKALLADGVERDIRELAADGNTFSFTIKPHKIVTVRLLAKPALRPRDPRDGIENPGGLAARFGGEQL
ncbi:MAG: glycosyl hydrolase-related protein [Opitutaceae bacterium]|jgi:hypothetical protein|nr:glycosyl hydrolase-related protein [Opitutaceae bacterium]